MNLAGIRSHRLPFRPHCLWSRWRSFACGKTPTQCPICSRVSPTFIPERRPAGHGEPRFAVVRVPCQPKVLVDFGGFGGKGVYSSYSPIPTTTLFKGVPL